MTQDLANQRPTFSYFKRHNLVLVQSHPVDLDPQIILTLLSKELWCVLGKFQCRIYSLTVWSLEFGKIFENIFPILKKSLRKRHL